MESLVVYGSEKPITGRTRVIIASVLWVVVGVPLFVGLWLAIGWWTLIGVALAVWATVDYVRRGGTGDVVDRFRYPL